MSDFFTDPEPKGVSRTLRDLLNISYGISDTARGVGSGISGIARQPLDWLTSREPSKIDFTPGFTPRPWQMTPPPRAGAAPTATNMGRFSGPGIDPVTGASTVGQGTGTPPMSPLEQMQFDMFQQMMGASSGGRSVDLSGYNASLKMLGRERKRMKKRYKKYSGQIADIYGTLTGINQSMIDNLAPAGEAMRADLSAQEAERAGATRATEDARLGTANEAREALGLEDLAGTYAGGDVVTGQSEGMITDSEARRGASENTMLANEAIARQQLTNQNLGRALQQEESTAGLQRSLEDALAAIRAERANVLSQRSQAASQASGGGPDWGTRMAGLQGLMGMGQQAPATDFIGKWMQDNPTAAPVAAPALNNFNNFVQTNYKSLFNEQGVPRVNPNLAIERFRQAASPADLRALNDPVTSLFFAQFFNSLSSGSTPSVK